MHRPVSIARHAVVMAAILVVMSCTGCTSFKDYVHNGFKVGPNYHPPAAPVAKQWIDAADVRVRSERDDLCRWWAVFEDPALDRLMKIAYCQNLTLREAGFRVLEARYQLAIARGEFFPQLQTATGSYRHFEASLNPPTKGPVSASRVFNQWNFGFNLAWELDFWGRFRRAITAAEDQVQASIFGYDDALVTLLGDVATNYVEIRTDQERIEVLQRNVTLLREVLKLVELRVKAGRGATEVDVEQARSNLAQTVAQFPPLELDLRQANNALCILLGIPAEDLTQPETPDRSCRIGTGALKTLRNIPTTVVVGIPADLLRRRPDVRRAERTAAAQAEQIGIAETDLYPAFTINGNLGWQAQNLSHLFTEQAFNGSIGPSFQWNLLNYGRIVNNVNLQDARFQELVVTFQQTVLQADQEVENGIVSFLQSQDRAKLLDDGVAATRRARDAAFAQYDIGQPGADFNRYTVIEQNLIQLTDQQAAARGQIAQGLILVYRALGGGWQIRCAPPENGLQTPPLPPDANQTPERVPPPPPTAPRPPDANRPLRDWPDIPKELAPRMQPAAGTPHAE
jgi:NodT family efflux transporter outer membrane factor (OMF) lipoprotein